MKKYGKYEKMPDGTRAKQPAVKSLLLQTYMTSLLCMVLCVAMFLGTTYAWFTSEVTNSGNEIYVGMLQAKLEKLNPDGSWTELNSQSEAKLYDKTTHWEPGYTSMETIKVSNNGNLSFRYALTFTDGTVLNAANTGEADTTLLEIAKHFTVYVHAGQFSETDPKPASFADLKASAEAEDGTWQAVRMGKDPATLADILTKELLVLSGNMENQPEEDTYVIALHMDETAGQGATDEESIAASQRLMGKSISLNVKLTAYQRTHESDAFDAGYDLQAHVTNLGKLDVAYTMGIGGEAKPMTLDSAYQFQPVESYEEAQNAPYRYYIADFAVWADREINRNSIALAGYYSLFCEGFNNGNWVALVDDSAGTFTTEDINEKTPIRLVQPLYPVTYELLCQYGNDGIGFLCGLAERNENGGVPAGTVITVELRLYEVVETNPGSGDYVETGAYTVAGRYTYVFE